MVVSTWVRVTPQGHYATMVDYKKNNQKGIESMKYKIYNYEGRLVASDESTILELLEENDYIIDPDEKDMKKLRIKHGVEVE